MDEASTRAVKPLCNRCSAALAHVRQTSTFIRNSGLDRGSGSIFGSFVSGAAWHWVDCFRAYQMNHTAITHCYGNLHGAVRKLVVAAPPPPSLFSSVMQAAEAGAVLAAADGSVNRGGAGASVCRGGCKWPGGSGPRRRELGGCKASTPIRCRR